MRHGILEAEDQRDSDALSVQRNAMVRGDNGHETSEFRGVVAAVYGGARGLYSCLVNQGPV